MAPTLIVLALLALAVGIVVWATRRRPSVPAPVSRKTDTAWNDRFTPEAPTVPPPAYDAFAHAPPSEEFRP